MADKNKDKDQGKGNTTENSSDLTGASKVSSENLDPNKPISNFSPTPGVSVEGGVPGVDAGVTNADATGVVDEDLAKAANKRAGVTGSQTDKLTAIQQQMQGTGRKDIAEPRGDVKVGDTTVDFSGQPTEDTAEASHEGETKITSADGRTLEVAINGESYSGKEIWVPNDQAGEIKRILADGGYFTK